MSLILIMRAGINKHADEERVGLFDTSLSKEEYNQLASSQQTSMESKKTPKVPQEPKASNEKHETKKPSSNNSESETKKGVFVVDKKQKAFDKNMVKIGSVVEHKAFGRGIVKDISGDVITIKFDQFPKPKMFEFPSAFINGFLTFIC